jgi:hypothetical protein
MRLHLDDHLDDKASSSQWLQVWCVKLVWRPLPPVWSPRLLLVMIVCTSVLVLFTRHHHCAPYITVHIAHYTLYTMYALHTVHHAPRRCSRCVWCTRPLPPGDDSVYFCTCTVHQTSLLCIIHYCTQYTLHTILYMNVCTTHYILYTMHRVGVADVYYSWQSSSSRWSPRWRGFI